MLNPILLWFLPLAVVPILLHLITLYRLKTVELSTFRFLMDSYIQQRRKIKLLEFLLMILRTAFVLILILTFSRPIIQRFSFLTSSTGKDVAIVIDNSLSMSLRSNSTTSLERSIASAKSIINMLGPDDRVTLVLASDKPTVLISRYASQRGPILDQLATIKPGNRTANLAAALDEVFSSGRRTNRIIYLLTDGSQRAFASLPGHPVVSTLAQQNQLVIMNVGPTDQNTSNLTLLGDDPPAIQAVAGLPVLLTATIANTLGGKPTDTTLSVFLDDQQVGQMNLSLQPGQKITRNITVTPTRSGLIRGRFQLPADAFPDDDTFLFSLNVRPKLNILLITPPSAATDKEPPQLFLRAAFEAPLNAKSADKGTGAPSAPGAAPSPNAAILANAAALASSFELNHVLNTSVADAQLTAADVVILADVPMDATLAIRLRNFVTSGGGLFIFPGPSTNPALYNTLLLLPPTPDLTPKLATGAKAPASTFQPIRLLEPVGSPDDEATFQPITSVNLQHPILSAFSAPNGDFFASSRLYRYYPLALTPAPEPVKPAAPVAPAAAGAPAAKKVVAPIVNNQPVLPPLLRLPDKTAVLAETRLGRGKILVAAFPATPNWSNVPLKPEFVPLLLRSVAHLRRPADAELPNTVKPGQPAPIVITANWSNATVEALDPKGKPAIIPLRRSDNGYAGAVVDTLDKGFYTTTITPRTTGAPTQLALGFSVNLDVDGANFNRLSEDQLKTTLKPVTFSYIQGSADDPLLTRQLTEKNEVWRTLLWTLFIIFGLDFALSTLSPRAPKPETSNPAISPATGPSGPPSNQPTRGGLSSYIPNWLMTLLGRPSGPSNNGGGNA